MAGDWIKVEKATPRKTEILHLSTLLGVHPDHAFGMCFRFWAWCDDNLANGHARNVTSVTLDYAIGHDGFSSALVKVGWLLDRNGSLEVPRFDRHLSQSAKNRALAAERKAQERSRSKRDSSVTIEEKRRDVIRERENVGAGVRRPTLEQAKAAARGIGITEAKADEWWHAREASEWIKGAAGGGTMAVGSNWQADLKTYASRSTAMPGQHQRAPEKPTKKHAWE